MKIAFLRGATLLLALCTLGDAAMAQQRALGIDVSTWQGDISQSTWNSIYNTDNRQFAWIRATRGGTTGEDHRQGGYPSGDNTFFSESQRYDDPYFIQNANRATAAGLLVGSYHFARPDNPGNTGTDDANHYLEMAGAWMRPGYLMPVFDLESGSGADFLAQFAIDFSQRIYDELGVRPGIYINGSFSQTLQSASLSLRNQLAQPAVNQPSMVAPAFPMLWNPRYASSPNIQVDTPKTSFAGFYGPWDDYGESQPWDFWQYTSSASVTDISPVDSNVSRGDLEYVKNFLVPAVWMNDSSGDWSMLTNWNSGQTPNAPISSPGQLTPAATGPLPSPRLPGAVGSGPTAGSNDTVILERPSANITVTVSSGTHNVRKLYMREALNITGGSLTVNYDPTYRPDNSANVAHGGPISAQFSGPVTLSGSGALNVHTLQVDPTQTFTVNGGSLVFNRINLMSHNSNPARLALNTDLNFTPMGSGTAVIANGMGAAVPGHIDFGGTTRTFNVPDGAPDVDLAVSAPIVNGGLFKNGAGTLGLNNDVPGGVTVSAGALAPGASIGAFTTSSLTFQPGTSFAYEIDPMLVSADLANVSGGLTIGSNVGLDFSALNGGGVPRGTKFTVISYDGAWNGGMFDGYPHNSTVEVGGNKYRIRYNDTPANSANGGAYDHAITLKAITGSLQTIVNGFTGYYAPENWAIDDANARAGFVDTSSAPGSVTLVGPNDNSFAPGSIGFTIQVPASGTLSFDWSYFSTDTDGFDFAYYINDVPVFLSTSSGESGNVSVPVNSGDVIGWQVAATDSCCGAGELTISNFSAPGFSAAVPEPAAITMAAIPLTLLGVTRRRRK